MAMKRESAAILWWIAGASTVPMAYGHTLSDYEWHVNPANGHEYALTLDHNNWVTCEDEAIALGGHLVTVNDENEMLWILTVPSLNDSYERDFHGQPSHNAGWIGLEHVDGDKTLPTSWEWQTGEPVTFWNPDIPDFMDGIHMFMLGSHHLNAGKWNAGPLNDSEPAGHLHGIMEVVPCTTTINSWVESFDEGVGRFDTTIGDGDTLFVHDAVDENLDATFVRNVTSDGRFALLDRTYTQDDICQFSVEWSPLSAIGGAFPRIGFYNFESDEQIAVFAIDSIPAGISLKLQFLQGEVGAVGGALFGEQYVLHLRLDGPGHAFTATTMIKQDDVFVPLNSTTLALPPEAVYAYDSLALHNLVDNQGLGATLASEIDNFTFKEAEPCTVSGRVWHDLNGDGVRDEGEPELEGVEVELLNRTDDLIDMTTTVSDGTYLFEALDAGDYIVAFSNLNGFALSPKDQGDDDALDSDVNQVTGLTDVLTTGTGDINDAIDAGMYTCPCFGDVTTTDTSSFDIPSIDGSPTGEFTPNGVVNIFDLQLFANILGEYFDSLQFSFSTTLDFVCFDITDRDIDEPTGPNGVIDVFDLQAFANYLVPLVPGFSGPCIELQE